MFHSSPQAPVFSFFIISKLYRWPHPFNVLSFLHNSLPFPIFRLIICTIGIYSEGGEGAEPCGRRGGYAGGRQAQEESVHGEGGGG